MKKLGLIMVATLTFSCNSTQKVADASAPSSTGSTTKNAEAPTPPPPPAAIPVAHNKQFIKDYFNETYQNILHATNGLTDEQLNFKPTPERWSVLECLEHIVITEPQLFEYEKAALEQPATPEKRSELKYTDDDIMTMMVDRSHKAKASAEMTPSGKYKNLQSALDDLQKQRKEILAYLENYSMEDLRNRVLEAPFGSIDAYQFMLFIPGHASRHTLQMQEVKADPNFPKK